MRSTISLVGAALIAGLWVSPVQAAGEGGCEGFAWPIETERALMTAADPVEAPSVATLGSIPEKAIAVKMAPAAEVAFLIPPTGKPKDAKAETYGAVISFDGLKDAGLYQVTLSQSGWIDLVQNGASLKAEAHTGKSDCEGVRKSVRFRIAPGPFAIQLSGASSPVMKLTIRSSN